MVYQQIEVCQVGGFLLIFSPHLCCSKKHLLASFLSLVLGATANVG